MTSKVEKGVEKLEQQRRNQRQVQAWALRKLEPHSL
jgi:hypothetical protein